MSRAGIRPEVQSIVEDIDELHPMLIAKGREDHQAPRVPE